MPNLLLKIIISAMLLMPVSAIASTGGPDGGGYTFIDSTEAGGPVYSFEDIVNISNTTSNSLDMTGDDIAKLVPIGFDFKFYGALYNGVYVSSNGHLDFTQGTENGDYNWDNLGIPQPTNYGDANDTGWGVNPLIAPFFDDLDPLLYPFVNSSMLFGEVYTATLGTPGDKRFVIQWNHLPHVDCPVPLTPLIINSVIYNIPTDMANTITYQATLYESSGDILFQYKDVNTSDLTVACQGITNGGSATVGLDFSQTVGLEYSSNTGAISNGLAILFQPGPDPDISSSAASIDFGDVLISNSSVALLTLNNAGGSLLQIDNSSAILNSPFSTLSDNCTGQGVTTADFCTMTLLFEPLALGAFSNTLIINSNDPDESPLNIPVTGTGVATLSVGDISVSDPDSPSNDLQADFGSNLIFSTSEIVFTVTNNGGGPLDISSVSSPVAPFSITENCSTLSPLAVSGSCEVRASFSPPVDGSFHATFDITSDDPDEPTVSVYVAGTAYATPPSAPQLVSPEFMATDLPTSVFFSWNLSVDPDPGDSIVYNLYVVDDAYWQLYGFDNAQSKGTMAKAGPSESVAYASVALTAPGIFLMAALAFLGPVSRRRKAVAAIFLVVTMMIMLVACGGGLPPAPSGIQVSGLTPDTLYHWKVVATDSYGLSTDSAVWFFTTAP